MARPEVVAYLARRSGLACLDALAHTEFEPTRLFTHRFERGTRQRRPELEAFETRASGLGIPLATPTKAGLLDRLAGVDYDFFVSVNASCLTSIGSNGLARNNRRSVAPSRATMSSQL